MLKMLKKNWFWFYIPVLVVVATWSIWKTHSVHVERGLYDCDATAFYHNH